MYSLSSIWNVRPVFQSPGGSQGTSTPPAYSQDENGATTVNTEEGAPGDVLGADLNGDGFVDPAEIGALAGDITNEEAEDIGLDPLGALDSLLDAHVGARIRISRNQSLAKMPGTDAAYTRLFADWLQMARETGDQAIEVGDGYTCMFDHDNPTLRGDAYYACSIDIVGMDRPGTYVSCKKFGGCELYFADNQGVIFDFEITSLKWNTRFSYAKSIPEAVKLWSDFALDFHKSFLGDTVYYESSVDAPKN